MTLRWRRSNSVERFAWEPPGALPVIVLNLLSLYFLSQAFDGLSSLRFCFFLLPSLHYLASGCYLIV